jgi:CHASE2 domain-containing sensor protein
MKRFWAFMSTIRQRLLTINRRLYTLVSRSARAVHSHLCLFRKELQRSGYGICVVAFLMLILEYIGWINGIERYAWDSFVLFKHEGKSKDVVIVDITDDDYDAIFGSTSPLDSSKLLKLIEAIQLGGPTVIAIDVDASGRGVKDIRWPEAVWSRTARENDSDRSSLALIPDPFLGGAFEEMRRADNTVETLPRSGICEFRLDEDGLVRRYFRSFLVFNPALHSSSAEHVDSFPWAIVKAYVENGGGDAALRGRLSQLTRESSTSDHGVILSFAGHKERFRRISATVVLQGAEERYWKEASELKGTIVLLGGSYRAAKDKHATPVGNLDGVAMVAHAVDAELCGGGHSALNHGISILVDLGAGLLFLYFTWLLADHRFGRLFTSVLIFAIGVSALCLSYLLFSTWNYWLNFAAVFMGVALHSLWEKAKEARELRRELDRCIALNKNLQAQQGASDGPSRA